MHAARVAVALTQNGVLLVVWWGLLAAPSTLKSACNNGRAQVQAALDEPSPKRRHGGNASSSMHASPCMGVQSSPAHRREPPAAVVCGTKPDYHGQASRIVFLARSSAESRRPGATAGVIHYRGCQTVPTRSRAVPGRLSVGRPPPKLIYIPPLRAA